MIMNDRLLIHRSSLGENKNYLSIFEIVYDRMRQWSH